ncbi:TIGR00288 family NYN domain-containing protein [Methanopyrus sp.]
MLDTVKDYMSGVIKRKAKRGNLDIAMLIDGPNMLRKEFDISLKEVRELVEELGNIRVGLAFLNQYASDKLIEAVANQGFVPRVIPGDVDVYLAVEAMELIYSDNVDAIALMTRDTDFLPIIAKAKEQGKVTIVIGADPGFSTALQNAADYVIKLKPRKEREAEEKGEKPEEAKAAVSDE